MIKLSTAAQNLQFANLKVPPTHAALVSRVIMSGVGSSMDVTGLTLNYWYGLLDSTAKFVPDVSLPTCVITLPDPTSISKFTLPVIQLVLSHLFGAGICPLATDPTKSQIMLSKLAGDHKIFDIDVVASFIEPKLNGTPI